MTLEQYWAALLKRWRLIIISFLLVGVGALIGSRLTTPLYKSTALVQVAINTGNDYTGLLADEQLAPTEAILATSDPILREVASHHPDLSIAQLSREVTATPKLNTQIVEIDVLDPSPTRAAALTNEIATALVNQRTQVTEQGAGQSDLHIVQIAQPALRPSEPNILLNTGAGLLTGLVLGMLLALLFERLDTHIHTPEALTQLLNWPVLGTIWYAARPSKETGAFNPTKEGAFNPTGRDDNVESYRILRTNIGFSGVDRPLRSLMITGALPQEGKSIVAANLAIFMAKAGKTTLLIDADLRRPAHHNLFGLSNTSMGLSNAILAFSMLKKAETPPLVDSVSDMPSTSLAVFSKPNASASHQLRPATVRLEDALAAVNPSFEPFVHSVGLPNLWVMPSGPIPPNPPELLDSQAMQRLLTAIANVGFEMVIIDTPPTLGLSDVSILASRVDGTLVVVDITRADKKNLKQVKAVLMQAGAHVLGCVVNKQRRSRHDSTYSYYYYRTDEQKGSKKEDVGEKSYSDYPTVHLNVFKQPGMENGERVRSIADMNSPETEKQSS